MKYFELNENLTQAIYTSEKKKATLKCRQLGIAHSTLAIGILHYLFSSLPPIS